MNKKTKRGFTIVELVIVIAIIGVLSAILIPTFAGLIDSAKEAADIQMVKNINSALAADAAVNGKHETAYDAIKVANDTGYIVEKLSPTSPLNHDIVWDRTTDRFMLIDNNGEYKYYDQATEPSDNRYDWWKIYDKVPETNEGYSIYLSGSEETKPVTVKGVGFDVGENTGITSVTYNGSNDKAEVVIRTNSFATTLTIDAPLDTVNHYDFAGSVKVISVDKIASYHENGTIGRIEVKSGHFVAEPTAEVFCLMDSRSAEEKNAATVAPEIKEGAIIHDNDANIQGDIDSKDENGIAQGHVDDCGAGKHTSSQLIVDNKYMYDVCTCCGYTLVHIIDSITGQETKTTRVDSNGAVISTPVESFNNDSNSVNEDGTVKTDAIPSVKATEIGNTSRACAHEFGEPEIIAATCTNEGSKTYTCAKCGTTMTSVIAKVAHKFYDVPSESANQGKNYEEKCLYYNFCHVTRGQVDVCQIGDVTYRTLSQAIATVADNTPTTITLIADEAIYGNAGYTINDKKDVTIDLNGHSICNFVTESDQSSVFTNNGKLTICDSTDTAKDGTGFGIIYNTYDSENPNVHVGDWWATPQRNYVTNVISNYGTLTIQSGRILETAASSICYAIDHSNNSREAILNIEGGLIQGAITAIRMICQSDTINLEINVSKGRIIGANTGIWIQLPGNKASVQKIAKLNVSGGTIQGGSYSFYDYSYGDGYEQVKYIISGGTFNGKVFSYGADFNISGGTFNYDIAIKNAVRKSNVVVTGGTFNGYFYTYSTYADNSQFEVDTEKYYVEYDDGCYLIYTNENKS